MLDISRHIAIPDSEIDIHAIRSQGPGGQNVNKVASAIHLRFDVPGSSLPDDVKQRLLQSRDYRINKDGVVVIKAQRFRTREQNLEDALERLRVLVANAARVRRTRKKTRAPAAVKARRLEQKARRGQVKKLRKPASVDDQTH